MAVAAYAAVVSLVHVLDQIQDRTRYGLHLDLKQIEALQDKVSFLQEFLELHFSQRISKEIEGLVFQISNVAKEAKDIVDSHVANQIRKGFPDHSGALNLFCKNIERVMEKIDSIKGKLLMVKEGMTVQEHQHRVHVPAVSTAPPSISSGKNTMVGFDEHLVGIMDELTGGYRSDLQVLPIVGMGGMGKTTLAKNVFDNPYIVHHFHVRLWVTISQEYSVLAILRGLLCGNREGDDTQKKERSDGDLADSGEELYKSLSGRKYLIVMDDVWSTKVWDDLHMFFPDNKNGSRVMVTTRLSNVALSFGPNKPFSMKFLDEGQSWNLFCEKAFTEEGCPPELEKIGKSIAKNCRGLPLAIVVIGGLLSKSNMTQEYWKFVAKNVKSFANSGDDKYCLKILSLSYSHLPIHLKPCFLHMRIFPENREIRVSKLVKLWIGEGFLKSTKNKTLEEIAREYLGDLIGRNLILIRQLGDTGKIKTCSMHDLLRDLCIRESDKEHFYHASKAQYITYGDCGSTCFLCSSRKAFARIYLPQVVVSSQPKSRVICLMCENCRITYPQVNRLKLVKILATIRANSFNINILHPTKLSFLSIFGAFRFLDNSIHLLWNLHTLVLSPCFERVLSSEIWELPQLRRLKLLDGCVLPDPHPITHVDKKDSTIILKNLRTLDEVINFRLSKDAIERIPNLKKLGIRYDNRVLKMSCVSLHNLGLLHELESLLLRTHKVLTLKNIPFPHSLKKIKLWYCKIPWEEMTTIGSLPNLEVLVLGSDSCKGPEWNPIEGGFPRLKKLTIWICDLVRWGAEKIHYPNLEILELCHVKFLEEIPSSIGEIETLRLIRLLYCKDSIVNSAKEILEEQHDLGNDDFQLYVNEARVPNLY